MQTQDLAEAIVQHVYALPPHLQRETMDFIVYLESRYSLASEAPSVAATEAFIARFAGCLGDDFPDEIDASELADDVSREPLE